mgnify:FL=1
MIEETLRCLLLLLGIVWVIFGIAYWRRLLNNSKQDPKRKAIANKEKMERADSNQERKELVRDELVGKSKPFISSSFPMVPKSSSSEKADDNPATFAELDGAKSIPRDDATEPLEEESETIPEAENEIQVAYTMEDPDEESILREELQIASEAMPELSPTAILARDLSRISQWSKQEDSLTNENEEEVCQTLRTLRGTELMDRLKEYTLQVEEAHRNLFATLRKAEELEEEPSSSQVEAEAGVEDKPLSYYL